MEDKKTVLVAGFSHKVFSDLDINDTRVASKIWVDTITISHGFISGIVAIRKDFENKHFIFEALDTLDKDTQDK